MEGEERWRWRSGTQQDRAAAQVCPRPFEAHQAQRIFKPDTYKLSHNFDIGAKDEERPKEKMTSLGRRFQGYSKNLEDLFGLVSSDVKKPRVLLSPDKSSLLS